VTLVKQAIKRCFSKNKPNYLIGDKAYERDN
jgi:hypothetical protein